jgi:predicted amidohydrolase
LRARAIETGSYIIAPAQTGIHPSGRETFGHSLIIDPWGEVMADAGKEIGIITAKIDIEKVALIRRMFQ